MPYEVFQAQDAYLTLGVANNSLWERTCRAIGREDLTKDPRFDTEANRVTNRGVLVPLLDEIFGSRPADEWLSKLEHHGVHRDEAEPHAGHDRLLDRLVAGDFHRCAIGGAMCLEEVPHRRARSGALFANDEILRGKPLHRDAPLVRERVIGRGDDHERVLGKRHGHRRQLAGRPAACRLLASQGTIISVENQKLN